MPGTRSRRPRWFILGMALVLIAGGAWSTAPEARGQSPASAADSGRYRVPDLVVISGSPVERGEQYGRHFAAGIKHFLQTEVLGAFVGKPESREDILAYATACSQVIQEECPIIYEELTGIAKGAGLTLPEVVAITLHEELYHRGNLPPIQHCTAVAISGSDNPEGRTLVGQTWDWMPSVAGTSAVVEWRRPEGPSLLSYGFPGLWTGAGINDRGLALCWTSAALGDKTLQARVGLPAYVLLAHLLYQENLDAVVRAAERNRHAGWFTFVMADAEGNLLNLEGSPAGIAVHREPKRLVRVLYGTRQMAGSTPEGAVKLHPRCVKMSGLLESSAGRNTQAALRDYFSNPSAGIMAGKSTIDMMVFDCTARTAALSRGPTYRHEWREFRFSGNRAAAELGSGQAASTSP